MSVVVSRSVGIIHELEQLAEEPLTRGNHLQILPALPRLVDLCKAGYPHIQVWLPRDRSWR